MVISFTPVWLELQTHVEGKWASNQLRVAKVECTQTDELCEGINAFPHVRVFHDGLEDKKIEIAPLPELGKLIEGANRVVDTYKRAAIKQTRQEAVNPKGEVVHLSSVTFSALTRQGNPWFVMFHAPWCSHCKQLAPIWSQVASELKGKVNVGKVDCTIEKDLMKRFNIKGFPTLIYFENPEAPVNFRGSRQLNSLVQFAVENALKPPFKSIEPENIKDTYEKETSALFFVYDPLVTDSNTVDWFSSVAKTVKSNVNIYVSASPKAFDVLSLENDGAKILAIRDNGLDETQYKGSLAGGDDAKDALRKWILSETKPLVAKLDAASQAEIFSASRFIVLAILFPKETASHRIMASFRRAAMKYKNMDKSVGRPEFGFAWIDGVEFSQYIERVYSIKSADLPRFVIADGEVDEYYDSKVSGKPFDSFELEFIMSSLEEVSKGIATPKSNGNIVVRTGKFVLRTFHRFWKQIYANLVMVFVIAVIAVIGYVIFSSKSKRNYEAVGTKTD